MTAQDSKFELPRNIERLLATLAAVYEKRGGRDLQSIVVNAKIQMREGVSFDDWDRGKYGHALVLVLPQSVYLDVFDRKNELQNQVKEDLATLNKVQNEFVETVHFEMEVPPGQDWRNESGLFLDSRPPVSPSIQTRIWGDRGYRVFISHKAEEKLKAAELKEQTAMFGASCFVAHADIEPSQEWQKEIEDALASMDTFVALLTEGFSSSSWTNQEVGFARARGVPVLSVKLGEDPRGFLSKYQALSCSWPNAPIEIIKVLIKHERMLSAYLAAIRDCGSYDSANQIARVIPSIDCISKEQVDQLVSAFNENSDIRGSYGFNGGYPSKHGFGLAAQLKRLSGRTFVVSSFGKLIEASAEVAP